MARLPTLDDLGQRPIAQPSRGVVRYDPGIVSRALQGAAGEISQFAANIQAQERDLARQNAALAIDKYKNFVQERRNELELRVAGGEFQAARPIDEELKKISEEGRKTFFADVSSEFLPSAQVTADSDDIRHKGDLHKVLFVSQQQQMAANLNSIVDENLRGAQLPGADVEETARVIEMAFETFGRSMAPDVRALKKQAALDNLYNNDLTRQIQFADNAEHLTGIVNGIQLNTNLSPDDKLRQTTFVQNRLSEIAKAEEAQRVKVEAAAKKAVSQIKDRVGTITLPTTEELQEGYALAELGGRGAEYTQALEQLNTVNLLARLGEAQQQPWLLERARLQQTEGATAEEVKNLEDIRTGLGKVNKLAKEDPASFAEVYLDVPVGDINWSGLETDEGRDELGILLQQRVLVNDQVRALQGAEINDGLLKASEAETFKAAFEKGNAEQKHDFLVSLAASSPDRESYQRLLEQTVGTGTVYGGAGQFLSRDETRTKATPWFSNAVTLTTAEVGAAIIRGQDLLSTGAVPAPPAPWLADQFNRVTGDAFQFASGTEIKRLIDTATAYGVGRGLLTKDEGTNQYDPGAFEEAISDVLGQLVEYNDHKVILPWGMDEDDFVDTAQVKLEEAFLSGALEFGQPPLTIDDLNDLRLVNVRDGVYSVLRGHKEVGQIDVLGSDEGYTDPVSRLEIEGMIPGQALTRPIVPEAEAARRSSLLDSVVDSSPTVNQPSDVYPLTIYDATKEEYEVLSKFRDDWTPAEAQSAQLTHDLSEQVLVDSESGLQGLSGGELTKIRHDDPRLAVLAREASDAIGLNPEFLNQIRKRGERSQSRGGKGVSISNKDAAGVYQFIPSTGREYGLYDFRDPVLSTIAAARFGKYLQDRYDGNIAAMLAYYNGGYKQGDPVAEGKQPPAKETRDYLVRTLTNWFKVEPAAAQQTGDYKLPKKRQPKT